MEALIPVGWEDLLNQAFNWLRGNVLLPGILAQAACALLLIGAVRLTARPLQRGLLVWAARLPLGPLYPLAAALARAAPPILLLLLIWFALLAFDAAGSRADLLRLVVSLVLVW